MHDLSQIETNLQESLSHDRHPLAIFIGAGCPLSVRIAVGATTEPLIPDIRGLTNIIISKFAADPDFMILQQLLAADATPDPTVETMLTFVRALGRVAGKGEARGLTKPRLQTLEQSLCDAIAKTVHRDLPTTKTPYHLLAKWIGAIRRVTPITIFTTNYDLLVEQALESQELPFFDGFLGASRPFFDIRAIEEDQISTRWTRLWKLHGSVNWRTGSSASVRRVDPGSSTVGDLLIHPSDLKYDLSRRMPYLAMMDRLKAFLRQPSAVLLTLGYSFADEHINEVIVHSLNGNSTAAAFGLLYGRLSDEAGAQKLAARAPQNLSIVSRDEAVLRGRRGPWMPPPSASPGAPLLSFKLGDFAVFCDFLAKLTP